MLFKTASLFLALSFMIGAFATGIFGFFLMFISFGERQAIMKGVPEGIIWLVIGFGSLELCAIFSLPIGQFLKKSTEYIVTPKTR